MTYSPATLAGLWAIAAYQRWLSPAKGFRCAHHACTGGMTCSNFGIRTLREAGLLRGLPRIRERLVQCSQYATDPLKGKISEDDPGPLTREQCGRYAGTLGCLGCFLLDPVLAWRAWAERGRPPANLNKGSDPGF